MEQKVTICQSNYIPWKGYFDMINSADTFVIYDDMQYTKNDWRNRNKIKSLQGVQWITIATKIESLHQKIKDSKIHDKNWHSTHIKTIKQNYAKAANFKETYEFLADLYSQAANFAFLSEVNYLFLSNICNFLDIKTKIIFSSEFDLVEDRTQRLIDICNQLKANVYYSGPAAKAYLNEALFQDSGIEIRYMDYSGYREYQQLYPPFEHGVSIIDLLLHEGKNAKNYLKSEI